MGKVNVSLAGGSGYAGGELLRLLLYHPFVEIGQVTSERHKGKPVSSVHPNLRKRCDATFCSLSDLESSDFLFLSLPHGESMNSFPKFSGLAEKIIDLSADFRLRDPAGYRKWYGVDHPHPELLERFVYGIPELHREEIRRASYVSGAGCNATAVILALYPFFKHRMPIEDRTVVEVKNGSSEGGNSPGEASHHPERSGCVRSYKPTGHRHVAEMVQELGAGGDAPGKIHFSATSIDMVRGVLATCHLFPREEIGEKEIWKLYRGEYGREPFIRIVKEREGIYRYPEPKLLSGTNFCDIGFEKDADSSRIVVISAIDNLMKGAAGQALQSFNLMNGFEEKTGLEFPGLHPA
jgi:LysW-gamma-L-alpha-aminoadipyl-6-phosphate/LysW-L-glutamyl-5-phosphate reductase